MTLYFYPRPPRGGRRRICPRCSMTLYFYPRPPRGGRLVTSVSSCSSSGFLSTPSARRATGTFHGASRNTPYFYPRPPRGGRPAQSLRRRRPSRISIHALREEGDNTASSGILPVTYFYPRPPRGGRPYAIGDLVAYNKFLSTPSARRATAKTETKSLFSNKLYNILHEFRRALIYNGSKNYPNHAK